MNVLSIRNVYISSLDFCTLSKCGIYVRIQQKTVAFNWNAVIQCAIRPENKPYYFKCNLFGTTKDVLASDT